MLFASLLVLAVGSISDTARTATNPPPATTPTHLKIQLEKVELESSIHGAYKATVLNTPSTVDVVANTGTANAKFGSGIANEQTWNGVRITLGSTATFTGVDPCTGDSVTDGTVTLPNATDQGVILQYQVPHPVQGIPPGAVSSQPFTLGSSPTNLKVVIPTTDSVICASQNPPLRTIAGTSTRLNAPFSLYVDTAHDEIGITNASGARVTVYHRTDTGDVAPIRSIEGTDTGLKGPAGIALDSVNDEIVVTNTGNNSITFYNRTDDGNQPPARTIQGDKTGLDGPGGIYVDPVQDEIGVADDNNNAITFYDRTTPGNQGPIRFIQGPNTGLSTPCGLYHDATDHKLFVTNSIGNSVTVYNDTDGGNNNHDVAPIQFIAGGNTGLSTPCGIYVDTSNDEIVVSNAGNNSVTLYHLSDTGNVYPSRTISGPATGLDAPSSLAVDTIRRQLLVTDSKNNSITTHDLTDAKPYLAQTPALLNDGWEQVLYPSYVFSGGIARATGEPLAAPQYNGYRIIWRITSNKIRQPADANSATLIPPANEVFTLANGTSVSNLALGCNALTPFTTITLSTNCSPSPLIRTPFPPQGGTYHVAAALFGKTQNAPLTLHVSRLSLTEVPRLYPTVSLSTNDSILGISWDYVDGNTDTNGQPEKVPAPFPMITNQQMQITLTQPYKAVSSCYTQVSGNTPTLGFSSGPLGPDARSLSEVKNNRCDIFLNDVATMTFTVTNAYGAQYIFHWSPN